MLDGRRLIDAHVHVPRLTTLKAAWLQWADDFSGHDWRAVYDADGVPVPAAVDALLAEHGVDVALLFCEYSPRSTGIQAIEHNIPLI
ncbi:MAG: amidohydrolase family protein, partial [Sciscionella sp.]